MSAKKSQPSASKRPVLAIRRLRRPRSFPVPSAAIPLPADIVKAVELVRTRYGSLPGVIDIAVGKRYLETERRFDRRARRFGGLVVKVLVAKKPKLKRVPVAHRIEKTIRWWDADGRETSVPIDVVRIGPARQNYQHGWPDPTPTNRLRSGRIFVAGQVVLLPGRPLTGNQVKIGTPGAVLRDEGTGRMFAVSAAHVFMNTCQAGGSVPLNNWVIGVSGQTWVPLEDYFSPGSPYDSARRLLDALLFAAPPTLQPASYTTPGDFVRRAASFDELRQLAQRADDQCFLWVERHGQSTEIPCTMHLLHENGLPILLNNCGGTVPHGPVIQMAFGGGTEMPVAGDSGAGIYWRENGQSSLLGFHCAGNNSQGYSYGMTAVGTFYSLGLDVGPGRPVTFV